MVPPCCRILNVNRTDSMASILDQIIGCRCQDEHGETFEVSCYKMIANSPMWIYIGLRSESNVIKYVPLERYDEMIQIS